MNINDINRKNLQLVVEWCNDKWGRSKYNGNDLPGLVVHRKKANDYGYYDGNTNKIHIFKTTHDSFIEAIGTIIHEYTHYLQNMWKYDDYVFNKGRNYDNHPYEITAFNRENKWKLICKRELFGK